MSDPMDPERQQRLRTELGRKGMDINQKLTDLLAGKNVTLATIVLPQDQKPGETKEERLRRFLNQISRAQKRLGTPTWGLCVTCHAALPDGVLDDTPWTEECNSCARR